MENDPLFYKHPYYAHEGNFFQNGHHHQHDSWQEFMENGPGAADEDYNAVWRWDLFKHEEDGSTCLALYYMLQRKAICMSCHVTVKPSDLPEVRKWLEGKWKYIQRLWAPLSGLPGEPEDDDS